MLLIPCIYIKILNVLKEAIDTSPSQLPLLHEKEGFSELLEYKAGFKYESWFIVGWEPRLISFASKGIVNGSIAVEDWSQQ